PLPPRPLHHLHLVHLPTLTRPPQPIDRLRRQQRRVIPLRQRLTRLRPALPTGLRLLLQRAERAGGDRLVPRPDQVGERLVDRLDAGLRLVEGRLVRGIAAGPLGERGGAVPGGVVG